MTSNIKKPDPINLLGARDFVKFARGIQPKDKGRTTPALDTIEDAINILLYLRDIAKKARHNDFDTTDSEVVSELLRLTTIDLKEL
jgi:hypothetical protein